MSDVAIGGVIALVSVVAVLWLIVAAFRGVFGGRGAVHTAGAMICPSCGSRGTPATQAKGSLAVEIILWLCLIIPGLIYSVWRMSSKQKVCPACRSPGMIQVNTPRGQQLAAQFAPRPPSATSSS